MKRTISLAMSAILLLALVACGTPTAIPNPPLVLGEKYLSDFDYEAAVLQFDQAIEIEPKNPRGYLGKADALLHLERQDEAVAVLATATKKVQRDQRENLQATKEEMSKSLEDGYVGLSGAYEKLGWKEIALALLKRVAQEFPTMRKVMDEWLRLSADMNDSAYYDGSVYQVFDEGMSWYEAKAYCENLGGHLATITSQTEQDFIEGMIANQDKNNYWLGGTNASQSGQWEWITGEPFEYTNWDSGQPDNANSDHYLQIYRLSNPHAEEFYGSSLAGKWNDLHHSAYVNEFESDFFTLDTIGLVCEWEPGYQDNAALTADDAVYFGGNKYKTFDIDMTWHEAKEYCESLGGHLATITSQAEQDFINELIGPLSKDIYWLGGTDESQEGQWEWVTSEQFTYSNWNEGQPDNYDGHEHYLHVYGSLQGSTGRWNDLHNNGTGFFLIYTSGFICEWDAT